MLTTFDPTDYAAGKPTINHTVVPALCLVKLCAAEPLGFAADDPTTVQAVVATHCSG